jgi:hypothetical protein
VKRYSFLASDKSINISEIVDPAHGILFTYFGKHRGSFCSGVLLNAGLVDAGFLHPHILHSSPFSVTSSLAVLTASSGARGYYVSVFSNFLSILAALEWTHLHVIGMTCGIAMFLRVKRLSIIWNTIGER